MVLRGTSKNARVTVVHDHKHSIAMGLWEKRKKERKKAKLERSRKRLIPENHQEKISFSLNASVRGKGTQFISG